MDLFHWNIVIKSQEVHVKCKVVKWCFTAARSLELVLETALEKTKQFDIIAVTQTTAMGKSITPCHRGIYGGRREAIFFSQSNYVFFAQLLLTFSTPLSTNITTFQQHLNSRNWSSADKHFDQVWGGVTGLNRPPGHLRQQRKWGGKSSSLERSQTQLQKRLRAIFGKQYFGLLANLQ